MKGKGSDQVDSLLPFVAASVDRARGNQRSHPTTHVRINISKLQQLLNRKKSEQEQVLQFMNTIKHRIQTFNPLLNNTFNSYCETGLYNAEVHLLDHVIENFDRFERLELLISLV